VREPAPIRKSEFVIYDIHRDPAFLAAVSSTNTTTRIVFLVPPFQLSQTLTIQLASFREAASDNFPRTRKENS